MVKNNKHFFFILLFSIFFLLFSCNQDTIIDQSIDLHGSSWHADSILSFPVAIQDTLSSHNILVNIRHNNDYKYQNIIFYVSITSPQGFSVTDTVNYLLADDKGKWFGKGLGDIYSMPLTYKQNVRFPKPGRYLFEIRQAMRETVLKDVQDVGLSIYKIK